MFKDNLRKYRQELNMTQEELGLLVGLNKKTISAYELGSRAPPNLSILSELKTVLNDKSDGLIDYNKLLKGGE